MSFVSYAQNQEDVMLARALREVEAGFYIDVGAQDPRIDSVTKAFYDRGWHGINLEPVQEWFEKLRQERPRDTTLRVAVGAAEGTIEFHEVVGTGLSTSSEEYARRHREQGLEVRSHHVAVRTLDAICAEQGVDTVHFLKVDAEGDEAAVLRGIDLVRLRPWIILVEATEPNAAVSTHAGWEPLLLERGYLFAYDDGLNRFYVASEHAGMRDAFATPPNVFDDFELRQLVDYRQHAEGLERHAVHVQATLGVREDELAHLRTVLDSRETAIAARDAAIAERETLLAERQALLVERDASIAALHQAVAERDANLASLHSHALNQERELQVRQTRLAALTTRLQRSEHSVAALSRSVLDAQMARTAAEAGWAGALADHEATLAMLAQSQRDFEAIQASRSWRLTRPLRQLMGWAQAARRTAGRLAHRWFGRDPAFVIAAEPAASSREDGDATQALVDAVATPAEPPLLPISEDAERILARYPVVEARAAEAGRS